MNETEQLKEYQIDHLITKETHLRENELIKNLINENNKLIENQKKIIEKQKN
jgi:hypothetical protein